MRRAKVLYKEEEAGVLTQRDDGTFSFRYTDTWLGIKAIQPLVLRCPRV
nr:HipA N-terminal domain-containing protein [Pleomorphovibrio marinus]